ncbi:MAG TPA: FAD/NAD(P)-binding oxidoreductase [bacterium]|nr:FAD/NAD(P)-binding oxidoreductase [bacterium]
MRVVILGGGFGGLTVATELRERLGNEHQIVIVDRGEQFLVGLRKLWALVGLGSLEEGQRSRAKLDARGIRFLRGDVRRIDPGARSVDVDGETLSADYLVVALGAETRPDRIPGLTEHAHDLYDARRIPALAAELERFRGGSIGLFIAGAPYKCPPAPYECMMLLDEHLRERGLRDETKLTVTTLAPILLPNAGKPGSDWLAGQLAQREIAHHTGRRPERVEPGVVHYDNGTQLSADLLIAVPPHSPPAVVAESGLVGEGGWVSVDPATLRTRHDNVFAIGDVTQIKLANGLPLPKAGLFAELEGRCVAGAIAAECGVGEPPAPFDGVGYCFIELGKDRATRVEGDFFARPEPQVSVHNVSARHAEDKRAFESERLQRWFGG